VYHAETKWIRSRGIPFRGGWGVNKDAGGGVLLDLGVHQVDDAWFVMGCPRPAAAFAGMHCAFSHLAPENLSMPYNADDATAGLIRFENGATLSFTVTFALHTAGPAGVVPASQGKKVDWLVLRVYGERAGVDVLKGKLVESQLNAVDVQDLPRSPDSPHPDDSFAAQTHEFVRAIHAGDDSMNTAEQAVMLMQMLDAVRESAHTGRSVEIAPVAV
jgi:predicted dehydrogenase